MQERCHDNTRTQRITFDPSMSMRTKLGLTSCVTLLYAPVTDPGLIRNLPSYAKACGRHFASQYTLLSPCNGEACLKVTDTLQQILFTSCSP